MSGSDPLLLVAGIGAWVATGLLAVLAVANWDPFWGFWPVLAAGIVSWAIGGQVVRAGEQVEESGS